MKGVRILINGKRTEGFDLCARDRHLMLQRIIK